MRILNLTQHRATPEQREAGVFDVDEDARTDLIKLLTFDVIPSRLEVIDRARSLGEFVRSIRFPADANQYTRSVMIGGAPFLMAPLEAELRRSGFEPLYAFSVRESVETTDADGAVRKTTVFRHAGFVSAV